MLKLSFGIWFAQKMSAIDEHGFHDLGYGIARRVEHTQIWTQGNTFNRDVTAAKDGCLKIDVGKKCIDGLRGTQGKKRLVHIACQQRAMSPVLYNHLCQPPDEDIVFDD